MNSHINYSLLKFKQFLDSKGLLLRWQYIVIALSISFFGGISWAYLAIRYGLELGIFAAFLGLIQGFLAFIYMRIKGDPMLIFYSIVFSLFSFFLGKYLWYVHYYDWIISGVVDKSELSYGLLFFYLRTMDLTSIKMFFEFFKQHFSLIDLLWIVIIISSSLEYLFFATDEKNIKPTKRASSGRRINRRFTGQKY